MYQSQSEEDFKSLMRQKWTIVILNVIVFVVACAIFGVCIWIRFDLDFWEWVIEIDWYTYWYCMYVIMVAMIIVAPTMVLASYGTIFEVSFALGSSMVLMGLSILLEFIGGIVILVYGVEESDTLTNELKDVFFKLIYRMDIDERANRILKIIQEYVQCCGARGSEDYIEALKPVPWECRHPVKGGEYPYGCMQQFAWWLEPWSATLAAVCFIFICIHIAQMVLTSKIMKEFRQYQRAYRDDDY